jgi:hypothetical protein
MMDTCHGVRLHNSMMVEGRKVPVSNFYVGPGKDGPRTSSKSHQAALMSESLAQLLVTKLNSTGHRAEVCELFSDENSTIHESLVDIGEQAPPPAAPPTSVAKLAQAIEDCLRQGLSPLEVLNLSNKIVLLG